jgi:N-acetylmuramoyl-L-alanine amidase
MSKVSNYLIILVLFITCLAGGLCFAAGLDDMVVCIDPGHQLHGDSSQEPIGPGSEKKKPCVSSGTKGPISGPEFGVNLEVALVLHDLLIDQGVTVVMTHVTADVGLCNSERAMIANRAGADLFVRLHCNSGKRNTCFTLYPESVEGWTDDIYEESLKAAGIVQEAYAAHVGIPSAGLTPRADISGFNWADVPVILPEMLHMQNEEHDAKAATPEFRQKMAEGLAAGIIQYLETLIPEEKADM